MDQMEVVELPEKKIKTSEKEKDKERGLHKVMSYPQTGFHNRSQPNIYLTSPDPFGDTWKVRH